MSNTDELNQTLKYYLLLLGIAIFFVSCMAERTDHSEEAKILLNLEREAIDREFKNDTAFLSSIMDTTFIELSNDKIKNKHEVLTSIYHNNLMNMKEKVTLDSFKLEKPVVHVYDNSAVVTFIMHTYRKKDHIPFERRTRFYDVWVKRNNEWKAVTWQATPIE